MKSSVQNLEHKLYQDLVSDVPLLKIFKERCHFVDKLLNETFLNDKQPASENDLCIVAVGSYGRVELNHKSDLDLLILHKNLSIDTLREMDQTFLRPFIQNTGRDVSIMNRSIENSAATWNMNFHEQTSSLEMRPILGSLKIFEDHQSKVKTFWKDKTNRSAFYNLLNQDFQKKLQTAETAQFNTQSIKNTLRFYHLVYWASLYHPTKSFFDFLTGQSKTVLFESLNVVWFIRELMQYQSINDLNEIKENKIQLEAVESHCNRIKNTCKLLFNEITSRQMATID